MQGGCWSLYQLHMGEGRVDPLMGRQLIAGPYVSIWCSMPCLRVPKEW